MKNILSISSLFALLALSIAMVGCDKEESPIPETNNTEIVKQLFAYFGSGDIPSFLNNCDANCVFDITGNQILNPGKVYTGNDGFMAFLGDLSSKGQPTAINPLDYYESGDVVTVNGNLTFTDFATSQTCSANFIQIWKFNTAGKLVYFKEDHDHRVCQ
ncbi:MAG: nuclear transport factor 2 family protein [Saprospiraceae bacterium]